jgi:hypothetical protein
LYTVASTQARSVPDIPAARREGPRGHRGPPTGKAGHHRKPRVPPPRRRPRGGPGRRESVPRLRRAALQDRTCETALTGARRPER